MLVTSGVETKCQVTNADTDKNTNMMQVLVVLVVLVVLGVLGVFGVLGVLVLAVVAVIALLSCVAVPIIITSLIIVVFGVGGSWCGMDRSCSSASLNSLAIFGGCTKGL